MSKAIEALNLLANILASTTLIAKPTGVESGLTLGDRASISGALAEIRAALQNTPSGGGGDGQPSELDVKRSQKPKRK